MLMAYFNYPETHIMIHRDPDCSTVFQQKKPNQRVVKVDIRTLGDVLADFASNKVDFGSFAPINDLWLRVSLNTPTQEESVVHVIHALLSRRYKKTFGSVVPKPHRCK